MVERWEENSYRHHLGQCSHLEQVAQDVVWLSFDYHQRWPLWPTCSSPQLTINIFSPLGLSGICCILIFAHCFLYLFLVISEKNLAWPFLLPSMSMSLLYRAQIWANHWRCVSPVLSKGEEPPPLIYCQNSFQCSSGYCLSPLLQGPITNSYSTWCPTEPQGPFLQSCFSDGQPPTQLMHGIVHLQMQDFMRFPQPVEILLSRNTSLWSIICKFTEGVLCHIPQVISEVLSSSGPSIDP